jgi:hypothetical protein
MALVPIPAIVVAVVVVVMGENRRGNHERSGGENQFLQHGSSC